MAKNAKDKDHKDIPDGITLDDLPTWDDEQDLILYRRLQRMAAGGDKEAAAILKDIDG